MPGRVLSGRICRKNGIRQLLTRPYSPATSGQAVAGPARTTIGDKLLAG